MSDLSNMSNMSDMSDMSDRTVETTPGRGRGAAGLLRREAAIGLALVVLVVVVGSPRPVHAQEVRALVFEGWRAALVAGYERDSRDQIGVSPFPDASESRRILTESLEILTRGYAYHPRLLTFLLGGSVTFSQEDKRSSSDRLVGTGDRQLRDYRVLLDLLRDHSWSYRFSATRDVAHIRATYFRDRVVRTSQLLHEVRWRNRTLPLRFAYDATRTGGSGAFLTDERRRSLAVEGTRRDPSAELQTRYRFTSFDDFFIGNNIKTHEFWGQHYRSIDGGRRSFRTSASGHAQSGGTSRFLLGETMRMRHSETFRSFIAGSLTRSRAAARTQWITDLGAGVQHRLYRSLDSSVGLDGQLARAPDERISTIAGTLSLDYSKRIPLGMLGLAATYRYEVRDEDNPDLLGRVDDEIHVVEIGVPIFLDRPAVVEASIVVADSTGVREFRRGRDYDVLTRGALTELRILPGGAIADGMRLRIRYDFVPAPDREFGNATQRYGADVRMLRVLSAFYRRTFNRYSTLGGMELSNLDPVTERSYGGELNVWGLGVRAERILHDSIFSPFRSDVVRESLGLPLSARMSLDLGADYSEIRYPLTAERTITRTARAGLHLDLTSLGLEAGASYRNEEQLGVPGLYSTAFVDVRWSWARYDFEGTYQYSRQDLAVTGILRVSDLSLRLRRRL